MSSDTEIILFSSPEHACGYLDDRMARNLIVDPDLRVDPELYRRLLSCGFRRSGEHVYRPCCSDCNACVPIRIPVDRFHANRTQRRILKRADTVRIETVPAEHRPEHYALYKKYTAERHPGGDMANADTRHYIEFLTASWAHTLFLELYREEDLLAVAVTDLLPDALSAIYTFFDPDAARLSPGILSVLLQIHIAQNLGLEYLYLGYWIGDCRKMSYKVGFRPHQLYIDGQWREFE